MKELKHIGNRDIHVHTPSLEIYRACVEKLDEMGYTWPGRKSLKEYLTEPAYRDKTVLVIDCRKMVCYGDTSWEGWTKKTGDRLSHTDFLDPDRDMLYDDLYKSISSLEEQLGGEHEKA